MIKRESKLWREKTGGLKSVRFTVQCVVMICDMPVAKAMKY